MREKELNGKFINATKWATLTEFGSKLITPIINMILARLISPEAFGIVTTVTMITSFADMFTDAGFQKYLVQHEFESDVDKFQCANVAFITNIFISTILWLAIFLFRERIAIMVGNPGLGNVISVACIQLFLTSFSSIQMSLYKREFDFKTLFIVRMLSNFVPIVVTIPLAFWGFSYWSLIIGNIFIQLINAIVLTIKSTWKPNAFFSVEVLKSMLAFSIWTLLEAILIWFSSWIDVLIVGSIFSQYYLGLYKTSVSMVSMIISLITSSIVPVLFSTLSRLQNDSKEFNKMYFKIQRLMGVFIIPLGIGIYLYSDIATNIILGSQWIEASKIIGICALTISSNT